MNRTDLQLLADARLADGQALIEAQRWPAAYYLLGYAVECGLKACAASKFRAGEIPDKALVNDFYTHRLDKLLVIADLKPALETRASGEPDFLRNWTTICAWNETARYDNSTPQETALGMLYAVADPTTGVLSWLKTQW